VEILCQEKVIIIFENYTGFELVTPDNVDQPEMLCKANQ
jgi:hypothetical protein